MITSDTKTTRRTSTRGQLNGWSVNRFGLACALPRTGCHRSHAQPHRRTTFERQIACSRNEDFFSSPTSSARRIRVHHRHIERASDPTRSYLKEKIRINGDSKEQRKINLAKMRSLPCPAERRRGESWIQEWVAQATSGARGASGHCSIHPSCVRAHDHDSTLNSTKYCLPPIRPGCDMLERGRNLPTHRETTSYRRTTTAIGRF